jgi:surfactin synthase thioesterase subunit
MEYPGHGQRLREPLPTSLAELTEDLAARLAADVRRPFAFFGHSLGALVAFELVYVLWRRLEVQPLVLFASGSAAPAMRDDSRYTRLSRDEDVLAELRRQGGTPPAALDDPEILELTLPIVRADLELCGKYRYVERPPLKCGIHAFGGAEDEGVPHERLAGWRHHSSGEFTLDLLPGGHFFTQQSESALLGLLEAHLAPCSSHHTPMAVPAPENYV